MIFLPAPFSFPQGCVSGGRGHPPAASARLGLSVSASGPRVPAGVGRGLPSQARAALSPTPSGGHVGVAPGLVRAEPRNVRFCRNVGGASRDCVAGLPGPFHHLERGMSLVSCGFHASGPGTAAPAPCKCPTRHPPTEALGANRGLSAPGTPTCPSSPGPGAHSQRSPSLVHLQNSSWSLLLGRDTFQLSHSSLPTATVPNPEGNV